jgi:CheY-like chemotaxis protein
MSDRVQILLVEDNEQAIALMREALDEAQVPNDLHVVHDGNDAIAFVRRSDGHQDAPRPDIVLLDLNLPRKGGREVLEEIKADPDLRSIPVVVLTTSASDTDVLESYQRHANAYVRKPMQFEELVNVVASIEEFWLGVVTLPPG